MSPARAALRFARSIRGAAAMAARALVVCLTFDAVSGHGSAASLPSPGSAALSQVDAWPGDDRRCREADVWLVSTRRLPAVCAMPPSADVVVERHELTGDRGRWVRSDVASLLADESRPLIVFIHGNRYEMADAKRQGVLLSRHLGACPSAGVAPRTVIFSWPSEQRGILLKDGRAKFQRAHADGHYLAWLLARVQPERPLAIVGYSFGALITAEAFADLVAVGRADRPGRTHVVLVAPAVRCDALAPTGPYRPLVESIDRLTLVINSRDDALRFFPLLDRQVRAEALGYVGMPRRWLPTGLEYLATDAASVVGKNHGLPLYLASPALSRRIVDGTVVGLGGE